MSGWRGRSWRDGVLAAVLLLLGFGCRTTAVEAARGRWYELRTPRFRVWTDGDVELARGLILDLERFHQVMLAKTNAEEHEAAPPLRIFVAKNRATFAALTNNKPVAGLFATSLRGNYALIDADSWSQWAGQARGGRKVLFHEYTHYMVAAQDVRVPNWYNEGFAEFMSATEFQDRSYTLGCPLRSEHGQVRRLAWMPIGRVMASDNILSLVDEQAGIDTYEESWYAVQYFFADAARREQLEAYLGEWRSGTPSDTAIERALHMTPSELDTAIQHYASQSAVRCASITPNPPLVTPAVEVRPIANGEAHNLIADLLLGMFGSGGSALEVLEQATAEAPHDPATLVNLSRAHWMMAVNASADDKHPEQVEAEFAKAQRDLAEALRLAPDDPAALVMQGHVHRAIAQATRAHDSARSDEELGRARAAYRKAIRLDETRVEAYQGLGATYLVADNGSQEAIVALEAAAYLLPGNPDVAMTMARVRGSRGHFEEALAAVEYALHWSNNSAEGLKAAQMLKEQLVADAAKHERE
jgi:tetratricopeptide (TPR) repeat protein